MQTFTYKCNKTGLSYDFETALEMNAQDAYAWRKGLNEYMDNYHASLTKVGRNKGVKDGVKVIEPWKDELEFKNAVTAACDEARDRFNAGDVPGTRAPADPKAALAKLAKAHDMSIEEVEAAILAAQRKKARAAA